MSFLKQYQFFIYFIVVISCSSSEIQWDRVTIEDGDCEISMPDTSYMTQHRPFVTSYGTLPTTIISWDKDEDRLMFMVIELPKEEFDYRCKATVQQLQKSVLAEITQGQSDTARMEDWTTEKDFSTFVMHVYGDDKIPVFKSFIIENYLYLSVANSKNRSLRKQFLSSIHIHGKPSISGYYKPNCVVALAKAADCLPVLMARQDTLNIGEMYKGEIKLKNGTTGEWCTYSKKIFAARITGQYQGETIPVMMNAEEASFEFKVQKSKGIDQKSLNPQTFSIMFNIRSDNGDSTFMMKKEFWAK